MYTVCRVLIPRGEIMKNLNLFLLFWGIVLMSFGTSAASSKLCGLYDKAYDDANKELSAIDAEGIFDNSAYRETNRQLRMLNERIRQSMTFMQMTHYGCELPKKSSGALEYTAGAAECKAEKSKGKPDSPKCDRSKWKSLLEDIELFK